jgi:hypothetical protein
VYLRRSESEAGLLVMAENDFSLNSLHSALSPSCAHVEERCKIIALQCGRGSWSARNQMAFWWHHDAPFANCELWWNIMKSETCTIDRIKTKPLLLQILVSAFTCF